MNIEINKRDKLAVFWLSNAEQDDSVLQAQLQQEAVEYQKQKYTVAVFCSGKADLQNVTEGLLLHNRAVNARRTAQPQGN